MQKMPTRCNIGKSTEYYRVFYYKYLLVVIWPSMTISDLFEILIKTAKTISNFNEKVNSVQLVKVFLASLVGLLNLQMFLLQKGKLLFGAEKTDIIELTLFNLDFTFCNQPFVSKNNLLLFRILN